MIAQSSSTAPVIVVGAGLAGLACARRLHLAGRPLVVLEASDGVGGRVRTDEVNGFLLDRGFQVLLAAYPEARAQLDYEALRLRHFYPGALVRFGGRWHRVADPSRRPLDAAASVLNPIGSVADKARVVRLVRRATTGSLTALFERAEASAMRTITELGFGPAMIERFWRPFLGGIFLERELATTSRMLDFVVRMMSEGPIAIPELGMGQIARQLASDIPESSVRTGTEVTAVDGAGVVLGNGTRLAASAVVVATEGDGAARLLGHDPPASWRSATNLYFTASRPAVRGPYLLLDGEGTGPVNNLCFPSEVSRACAPPGQTLVSASVLGSGHPSDAELLAAVRRQLEQWFGGQTREWTHLRTYRIRWAQPDQSPPTAPAGSRAPRIRPGVYVAGDHRENASINGALASGRRAAEAILGESP